MPRKGNIPWNKGTKGLVKANSGSFYKGMKRSPLAGVKKGSKSNNPFASGNKINQGRKASIETRRKMSDSHRGENAWNWKGGLEFRKRNDERNDSAYLAWARTVKLRDNWKCQFLGKDCEGNLVAHHILPWRDYPAERYNVNNGITLCEYHHPRKRKDELKSIPLFQDIIDLKKNK